MAAGVKNFSRTFVWIILGLLVLGLAGFGATNFSGTVRSVATVGDQQVGVQEFARELQREIRAIESQTGQPIQMSQARAMGLDRLALARLVTLAAIDNEVAELGLSVGDGTVQRELLEIPAFQGVDGNFNRDAYRFALDQAGTDEAEFEADLRAEAARTMVQGAIVSGVEMPKIMTETMIAYIGARRSFTMAQLDASALETPIAEPTDTELRAYYDENVDAFMLPETKKLTYALLTPEMILDQVEVDDEALRQLYESRIEQYQVPERRLVERLVFASDEAASSAKAQLDVGGTTFETLVESRGLSLGDVDMGDVTRQDLEDAADAVFAAEIGDVVGPLPSSLGPALFRVNGVLAAQNTDFETAKPELRDELAGDRTRRLIESQAETINDMLAGGATLEELGSDTDMETGSIDWTPGSSDGVAAYDAFRQAASTVTADDFPEIAFLEDGGIFALRLDEVLPPRPQPFEEARDAVAAAWTQEKTEAALTAQAQQVVDKLEETGDFTELDLPFRVENGLTRTAFIEGAPPGFMSEVFDMEKGEIRVIPGGGQVYIVRLDDILPPDDTDELKQLATAYSDQMDQALSAALFDAFARDAQSRAQPVVDQNALNAVLSNFQ